ncbi:MAG: SGNH/GDSL hydrolase family protein [Muribaculaceae bacterium]
MKKIIWALFYILLSSFGISAQVRWYSPINTEGFSCIHNQGWNEDGGNYKRFPNRAKEQVRLSVWNLSCESAGLAIRFVTNSHQIKIRYQVTGSYSMPHMPSTGVSGVDLYVWEGETPYVCYTNYQFADTIRFNYIVDRERKGIKENKLYELFLPLYNGVKWLEIGVDENDEFSFVPVKNTKPIVVYGTSITQGACASRPGMAWTNILSRKTRGPVVNLGFSGNGKLEKEVISLMTELDAKVYVIDCMANLYDRSEQEICCLVEDAVKLIRSKRDTPILLIEHVGYSNSNTNKKWNDAYVNTNKSLKMAYNNLLDEHIEGLYYLSKEELDPDSWVDYVHLSDYGMIQHSNAICAKLKKIKN